MNEKNNTESFLSGSEHGRRLLLFLLLLQLLELGELLCKVELLDRGHFVVVVVVLQRHVILGANMLQFVSMQSSSFVCCSHYCAISTSTT